MRKVTKPIRFVWTLLVTQLSYAERLVARGDALAIQKNSSAGKSASKRPAFYIRHAKFRSLMNRVGGFRHLSHWANLQRTEYAR